MITKLVALCRTLPMIKAAHLVQIHAAHSSQTTSPILGLELTSPLPANAFAAWPEGDPLVIVALSDDLLSRFIRLTTPIYVKPDLSNGRGFAGAIAAALDAIVKDLPSRDHTHQYAVALADGRIPVLVRDFGHAIHVVVLGVRDWQLPAKADGAGVVADAAAAARAWATEHEPDKVSIIHAALHLSNEINRELGERWTIGIPSPPDPTEIWLHGATHQAASVGVFRGSVRVWLEGTSTTRPIGTTAQLAAATPVVIAAVRAQLAAYERNVGLAERIRELAAELVRALDPSWFVAELGHASSDRSITATLLADPDEPALVTLRAEDGRIRAHAGLTGSAGWDGELSADRIAEDVPAIRAAIELARRSVTVATLRSGQRFRVLESLQSLQAGALVTFARIDDIDNHYGEYVFLDANNNELIVGGDLSSSAHGPLAEAHRYLQRVTD